MNMHDSEILIKRLMAQCGHPDSLSVYLAFKQFQIDLECSFAEEMTTYALSQFGVGNDDVPNNDLSFTVYFNSNGRGFRGDPLAFVRVFSDLSNELVYGDGDSILDVWSTTEVTNHVASGHWVIKPHEMAPQESTERPFTKYRHVTGGIYKPTPDSRLDTEAYIKVYANYETTLVYSDGVVQENRWAPVNVKNFIDSGHWIVAE